ncbi:hypothetical protein ACH4C6_25380 [Streptomyces sp. NPDC017943]|uniref:hypothetical protein n=1 Tax=Streptomyces sp. NPDC017943 TaxID=3365019 RepID=UPI0037AEAC44
MQTAFQAHRLGVLIVGATAVIGLVAAAVGLFFTFFPDLQPKPESKSAVKIQNVAVGGIKELHGETEVPGYKKTKRTFEAPVLDVLLSNEGNETSYVKSATFTFFAAQDMHRCSRIGGGNIDYVTFEVGVPPDVKPGDTVKKATFFQVRPGKGEALAFSLGPTGDSVSESWLYGVSLDLGIDSASVSIPDAAVSNVTLWSDEVLQSAAQLTAPNQPEAEKSRTCFTRTLDTVNDVLDRAKHVPAGLQEFAVKLEAVLAR